jgi:L-fuconolactonase
MVDAHHHLWDRQSGRYLAPEFSHDIETSGHRADNRFTACRRAVMAAVKHCRNAAGKLHLTDGFEGLRTAS